MRSIRTEEASACAARIGKAIEKTTKKYLRGIDSVSTSKELWDNVRVIQGKTAETRKT